MDVKLKSGICALWPEMQGAKSVKEYKHSNYHLDTNKRMHTTLECQTKERKKKKKKERHEAEQTGLECVVECREDIEMTWV